MPILTEGADEAEAIAEDIKKKRSQRFRIQQLAIKDGDDVLLRFYTDHNRWISADIHSFIPTKEKPAEYTGQNWPKSMWAVCMKDRMFRLRDSQDPRKLLDTYEEGYGVCYIHDALAGVKDEKYGTDKSIPGAQVLGLAVLREPVRDPADPENGPVIGFKDKMTEWTDEKGTVYQLPHFVIINQKYSNFWSAVKASCYVEPRTACNKDFRITRTGNDYNIATVNLTPDFMPGSPAWSTYDEALKIVGFDLREYVIGHSTADHYARWFVPGATPKDGYGRRDSNSSGAAEEDGHAAGATTPAGPQVDQAAMADFRASLSQRGGK